MKKYALIGKNISHYTLSPKIHPIIYEHLGIEASYAVFDGELEDIMISMKKLDGFNVTQPYKEQIKNILHENYSNYDGVNTVIRKKDKLIGYNTDAYGFEKDFLPLVSDIKNETFHILGRGATSRLIRQILSSQGMIENMADPTIVINASAQFLDKRKEYIPEFSEKNLKIAYDTIYFDTTFNKHYGCKNGLGMLIYQAIEACRLFFEEKIEDEEVLFNKILEELSR
ncbi:MAG: hypothetical protein FWE22_04585 [Firmicutes bacterium]|nr:hypothetical protein [Bacillota bacterium]